MGKSTGLGGAFWISGNDVSGDTQQIKKCGSPQATIDLTAINKSAYERTGGLRDGGIDWVSFFNPTGAHPVLSALPTADALVSYIPVGTALGNPVCAMVAKQLGYDGNRTPAGDFTFDVQTQASEYGLEWGKLATPGFRTDTAATNGTAVDDGTASAFGAQFYLHFGALTGTDVTIKMQDSADNVTFADVAGGAFTQVTSSTPSWQRLPISNAATLRRYVRVATTTVGGFTSATFAVIYNRNPIAGVIF